MALDQNPVDWVSIRFELITLPLAPAFSMLREPLLVTLRIRQDDHFGENEFFISGNFELGPLV